MRSARVQRISSLTLVTFLTAAATTAHPKELFEARRNYRTGTRPKAVVIVDLNHDAHPDLAVANTERDWISILLGRGDATFDPAYDVETGFGPTGIASADLDDDGNADLITANEGDDSVSVLLGRGDGGFLTATDYPVEGNPYCIALGDLDRNGALDIVVPHRKGGTADDPVGILLGNGDGTFQEVYYLWGFNDPWAAVTGDFDHDDNVDIAVTSRLLNWMSVLLGVGDGTFEPPVNYTTDSYPMKMAAAHLTGDEHLDLLVAHGDLNVFFGHGDGSFSAKVNYDTPGAYDVAVGDVDGDGDQDIALANSANCVSLLMCDYPPAASFHPGERYPTGTSPAGIALGDLDGDGDLDMVSANDTSPCVSVFTAVGDGTYLSARTYAAGDGPLSVTHGDLNLDGVPDIVAGSDAVYVYLGMGDGSLADGVGCPGGGGAQDVLLGDFNNDGVPDVAAANWDYDRISVMLGDGSGGLGAPIMTGVGEFPAFLTSADFDRDGLLDLAVSNRWSGDVWVLLGAGDGTFEPLAPVCLGSDVRDITSADFDRDGIADLAVARTIDEYASDVALLLGLGDGTFSDPLSCFVSWDPCPTALVSEDLDADGTADLVVTDYYTATARVLRGVGDGTFLDPEAYAVRGNPDALTLGDFTADGIPDLCVIGADVSVLSGAAGGLFEEAIFYGAGMDVCAATAPDLNRDGDADLVVANSASDDISVLISTASPLTGVEEPTDDAQTGPDGGSPLLDLLRAGPNPFSDSVTLTYRMPSEHGPVRLVVYDVSGRAVCSLAEGPCDRGAHTAVWHGLTDSGVPAASGVYFARLEVEGRSVSRKLVLLR